jgi:outer membrane protein TolC
VNSITTNRTVGVQLTVPIYQGGAIDSRERQAVAQVREAEAQLELAQHRVRQEVQQAYFAVKESLDRMEALELAVQSAAQVVVANEQSFKAGLRTTLDIVAAQQREAQARLDLQSARLDLVMGRVRLDVSVGEVDAPR